MSEFPDSKVTQFGKYVFSIFKVECGTLNKLFLGFIIRINHKLKWIKLAFYQRYENLIILLGWKQKLTIS